MPNQIVKLLLVLVLLACPALHGQATEASINAQLQALGVGGPPAVGGAPMMPGPGGPGGPRAAPMPEAQRPAAILQAAKDIRTLPAGPSKVRYAESLYHASVQGTVGAEALQAAADTLAQALGETPEPVGKDGLPGRGYMDLAKLKQFVGITTDLKDPMLTKADEVLTANEADLAKVDFTLKDVNGKKWTLSALKGKIVLVHFWSWSPQCEICHKEMQDLDLIYTHFQSQGLVILSVITTPDDVLDLNHLLTYLSYHPPVLLDNGGKVGQAFHIDSRPRSFVFDRDGKLVGQSLDLCTQRQFFTMLGKAGLHP
jgi:peroxiredoxin